MIKGIIKHTGKDGLIIQPIKDTEDFLIYIKDINQKIVDDIMQNQLVEFDITTKDGLIKLSNIRTL